MQFQQLYTSVTHQQAIIYMPMIFPSTLCTEYGTVYVYFTRVRYKPKERTRRLGYGVFYL